VQGVTTQLILQYNELELQPDDVNIDSSDLVQVRAELSEAKQQMAESIAKRRDLYMSV